MNKRGLVVLRDVVFMMMIVSSIFVFAGLYVGELAFNYDNTNMSEEWGLTGTSTYASTIFNDTKDDVAETGGGMSSNSTGIWSLIEGTGNTLKGIGDALFMVLLAPNTIGNLLYVTLVDIGAGATIATLVKWLTVTILWGIVIFTIASAFLRGGKL